MRAALVKTRHSTLPDAGVYIASLLSSETEKDSVEQCKTQSYTGSLISAEA